MMTSQNHSSVKVYSLKEQFERLLLNGCFSYSFMASRVYGLLLDDLLLIIIK